MGASSLRPFLQSLCCNSPWNYAVFWKLKYQHEMILAWEDGFCDIIKPRDPLGNPIEDFHFESSNTILSSNFSSSLLDGIPGEYPIGLAVAEMSSAFHVFGKGVVGEVAFTGNPRWIYTDNIATDVFDSVLVAEYPDEWLLQFIAGIKTILLLPVIPDGVLQLGSVEMVAEDAALVAYAKQKFEFYKRFDGYDSGSPIQQFSLMSTYMENIKEPSSIATNKTVEDQSAIHSTGTKDCNQLAANQMMPAFMVQDLRNTFVTGVTNSFENLIENESSLRLGMIHVVEPQISHLSCENKSDVTENDLLKSFHLDDNVRAFLNCDNFNWRKYGEFVNELRDFHFEEGAIEPNSLGNDFDFNIFGSGSSFLSFPSECELHKALGPAVVGNTNNIYVSSISDHNAAWSSISDRDLTHCMDLSGVESTGFPLKEDEMERLLDAVVADACSSSDDKSNISRSLKMSPDKLLASSKISNQLKRSSSRDEDTAPCGFLTSAFIDQGTNTASTSLSASSIESTMSALIDKQQQWRKGNDSLNQGKGSRLSSTNKRKLCAANNQRPRPRDRQLIQDRIKDLRELVPNSDRCSIDGLLDKTIKHMLFLRGVTDQADKLRHQVLEVGADEKITKTSETNCGNENGTSWAVELGSDRQQCPIVVKDLDHPGQMLIEMLCTDHGRFLEIADVIHCLQLTILKAVMEKCTENSWARFIVEASGSFQRLDIFWPLMQLLHQSRPSIGSIA